MNKRQIKKKRKKEIYRDTWNLDWAIAKFIYPRLVRFKEVNNGYPGELTPEEWNEILDKMIKAFEIIKRGSWNIHDYENAIVNEGLDLFRKYYFDLWW